LRIDGGGMRLCRSNYESFYGIPEIGIVGGD
jgi:hypothetical protein